jgi:hypothetical protein
VIVFQPAISGAEILLPRDADFGLVWGGGLAGFNVTLRILTPRVALTCSYPADSGQALVPILALRNLPWSAAASSASSSRTASASICPAGAST